MINIGRITQDLVPATLTIDVEKYEGVKCSKVKKLEALEPRTPTSELAVPFIQWMRDLRQRHRYAFAMPKQGIFSS